MSETDFIRAIARRTGCGLLLDVNNVFVSATNHGFSPLDYLSDYPLAPVGEIHLAGHTQQSDDEGDPLLIDSHDRPVANAVWGLFESVVAQTGPLPTLIEWDSEIPEWPRLAGGSRRCPKPSWTAPARSGDAAMRHDPSLHAPVAASPAYSAVFSAALLKPDRETPALVSGPAGKAAAKRYNVYRNNVTVSLIDTLAGVYPAVQRITGVEFFRAMARFHIRETPPTSPLLFEYGRDFPAFIERYEYAQGMPWLADTARIERAWLDAYHEADAAPLTASDLASFPPERLADLVFAPIRRPGSCARVSPP